MIKVLLGPAPTVSAEQVTEMHADSVGKLSTNKNEFNVVMKTVVVRSDPSKKASRSVEAPFDRPKCINC